MALIFIENAPLQLTRIPTFALSSRGSICQSDHNQEGRFLKPRSSPPPGLPKTPMMDGWPNMSADYPVGGACEREDSAGLLCGLLSRRRHDRREGVCGFYHDASPEIGNTAEECRDLKWGA